MSFQTDWKDFITNLTITEITGTTNTGGIVTKTTATRNIYAIVQTTKESKNNNADILDRELKGKNEKGDLSIITDENLEKGTTFIYEGKNYRIDNKNPVKKILPHYKYIAVITKI